MPVGPILLTILLVLIYTGFFERVLQRMGITERRAMLLTGGMLIGSLVEISLAPTLTINLGGGLIPLGLVVALLITARDWLEVLRALSASVVTASAIYIIHRWFPPGVPTELNLFFLDAQYIFGLMAGLIAYLVGRSYRAAFCAAVLGVLLADIAHYMGYMRTSPNVGLIARVGGGGAHHTAIMAGVLALLLAAWVGESGEAISQGAVTEEDPG